MSLYFGVRESSGNAVSTVRPRQLSVTVGGKETKIKSISPFEDTGSGVAYVFLADVSRSLESDQHERMRQALQKWVEALSPEDAASLLKFGSSVDVVQDFTSDRSVLKRKIRSLRPTDQRTMLHRGIVRALELGRRRDPNLPKRRVIIVLSDGRDDIAGGITESEVQNQLKVNRTPIYAIGYAEPPVSKDEEAALDKLSTFAYLSGGQLVTSSAEAIEDTFDALRSRIEDVFVAELLCKSCRTDGEVRRLQVQLTAGSATLTDGLNVRMQSTRDPSSEPSRERSASYVQKSVGLLVGIPWWGYVGGATILVAAAFGLAYFRENEERGSSDQPPASPTVEKDLSPGPPSKTGQENRKGTPVRFDFVGEPTKDGQQVRVDDRRVLGRSPDCDVVVSGDTEASRENTEIVRKGEELYICDLNSQNGTFVNGVPISGSYQVEDGDQILVGRTELRITILETTKKH